MGNSSSKTAGVGEAVNIHDFDLLRLVGKGNYGRLRLVQRRGTRSVFAMKYIKKEDAARRKIVPHILRERWILEQLDHPLVCKLWYSFQDSAYLYMVLDLCTGGDLRFHISRKSFTEEAVRFWIAELGCALSYIHGQGIVHRDVKPDNVVLDDEGHIRLIDFNTATCFTPEVPLKAHSGTLAYQAPEVFSGRGYGSAVDWWSLGVLLYECIYGKCPFEAASTGETIKKILKACPKYPQTIPEVSEACQIAIQMLLERDAMKRLGVMNHKDFALVPWLAPFDFALLANKQMQPIFCPRSGKSHFDDTCELEENLLGNDLLQAAARKQKPRTKLPAHPTAEDIRLDEMHRMMETHFTAFDVTQSPSNDHGKIYEHNSIHQGRSSVERDTVSVSSHNKFEYNHNSICTVPAVSNENQQTCRSFSMQVSSEAHRVPKSWCRTPGGHAADHASALQELDVESTEAGFAAGLQKLLITRKKKKKQQERGVLGRVGARRTVLQ